MELWRNLKEVPPVPLAVTEISSTGSWRLRAPSVGVRRLRRVASPKNIGEVMGFKLVPILFIAFCEAGFCSGQVCYSISEFRSVCSSKYRGVVNGGRCFFLAGGGSAKSNWRGAFGVCRKYGGSLAQIHSGSEFGAIRRLAPDGNGMAWIALNKGGWHKEDGSTDTRLTIGKTFARVHQYDNGFGDTHEPCYHLWKGYTFFGDWYCDPIVPIPALCTVYNPIQEFNPVPGKCMNERIVESHPKVSSPEACAIYCRDRIWCRSFNWYSQKKNCELFSWYYKDTRATIPKPWQTDCSMFSYVP